MEFKLLGPFEVWHDGRRVNVGAGQQIRVLVTLLLNANRPVSAERLAEIVWPNPVDRKPRSVVTYVSRLNGRFKAIGVNNVTIVNESAGYVLQVDRTQIDMVRFDRLRDQARQATADGEHGVARALLHEVLDMYRGEFLADLEVDRAERRIRAIFSDAQLDTLADLADLELAAGDHRWVRDRLHAVVRENPLRQRLAAALMEAFLVDGDPERAVAVYYRTNEALDARRGMRTSTKLKDLLWRAQYGEAKSSLPPKPAGFVGRRDELEVILVTARRAAARGSSAELLWISGMPGIGKTALAIHAAYDVASHFPDGLLYIDLHGFTPNVARVEPGEALDQLLRILGVPADNNPPTIEGKMARYRAWLEGTRTLVILDNVDAEARVERLLPVTPGCLAIVTSRHVGGPRAETRIHLDPLPATDAVQLLCNVAGRGRISDDWTLAEEIVWHCGCVPLQVKVVATQFLQHPTWPLDHLAGLLREYSPLQLNGRSADQTGAAACTVSYQHLDDAQRQLFRLVGWSPCPDLEANAVAALARTSLPRARILLEELHRVSLLTEIAPERYRMPDLLRAYAASLPAEAGSNLREELRPLLDYYLNITALAVGVAFPYDRDRQPDVVSETTVDRQFAGYDDALNWLSIECTNLVAIVRYAAEQTQREYCWRLAVLLWRFFYTTGRLKSWTETLELALGLLDVEPNPRGLAHVLLRLAGARWFNGDLEAATELATRALSWWTSLGDVRGQADALCAIAFPETALGRYPEAREHLDQALSRYEYVGDFRGQANTLDNLGVLEERAGNYAVAEGFHLQAQALLGRINHRSGQVHSLDNVGSVRQKLGRLDEALADHRKALELAEEIGDRSGQAHALNNIGNAHRRRGRCDEAVEWHRKALRVAEAIGNINLCTDVHNDLGESCRAGADHHGALANHTVARELSAGTGDRRQAARADLGMAHALHELERHEKAAESWRAAVAGYRVLNLPEAGAVAQERDELGCACRADG